MPRFTASGTQNPVVRLVPPRAFSEQNREPTAEWVEVGPGERIAAFTIVYERFRSLLELPCAFGYLRNLWRPELRNSSHHATKFPGLRHATAYVGAPN
jgi:hypothetical protein